MKKEIQEILDKTDNEHTIFVEVNEVIKTQKRLKRGRKTYDFPEDISLLAISYSVIIPNMSAIAIYEKMRNDKNKGFSPSNENKEITKALIEFTGKTRKELLIDFPK